MGTGMEMSLMAVLPAWMATMPWLVRAGTASALWLCVLLCVSVCVAAARDLCRRTAYSHLRTWPSLPLIGHVPYLVNAPWERFWDLARSFGGVSLVYIWSRPHIITARPDDVKRLCVTDRATFPKDLESYEYFGDVLGSGLVTSEGEKWKRGRALLSPAFHFAALARLQAVLEESATTQAARVHAAAASLTPGEPLRSTHAGTSVRAVGDGRTAEMELSSAFRGVTLEIISRAALGLRPEDASVFPSLFESVVDELNARVFEPWRKLMLPIEWRYRERLGLLNGIVLGMIRSRRAARAGAEGKTASGSDGVEQGASSGKTAGAASGAIGAAVDSDAAGEALVSGGGEGMSASGRPVYAAGSDILDLMLDSGLPLSDKQLADELKTQLMAGHETSSMMLTWSCYLLARHPAAMAKAVAEVDRVLGLAPGVTQSTHPAATTRATVSFDDFKALEYLGWVFKEAMRIYSPVPVLNRVAAVDTELGGVHVPAGTTIIISVWGLHQNSDIWGKDVGEFRPERFSPEESRTRHPFAYIPFSVGPRNCIGQNLAIMEGKVILGTLLRHFHIELAPGCESVRMDTKTAPIRPADRVIVRLTRRT